MTSPSPTTTALPADTAVDHRPDATAELTAALSERVLVLDGAMGTMIQREGLSEEDYRGERFADWPSDLRGNNDLLSLTNPTVIEGIHRAYLEAGATSFFVPGKLDEETIQALVAELGPQKVNVIGVPGMPSTKRLGELGVARCSFGPWSQNVALTALAKLAEDAYAGGGLPDGTRMLN